MLPFILRWTIFELAKVCNTTLARLPYSHKTDFLKIQSSQNFWTNENMLFLYIAYCDQCCNEHEYADITLRSWIHFLWIYTQIGIAEAYGSPLFNILRFFLTGSTYIFYNGCASLHSHQLVQGCPFSYILLFVSHRSCEERLQKEYF